MRSRYDVLEYCVNQMCLGQLEYRDGQIWRLWERRRNWLPAPVRADTPAAHGYREIRATVTAGGESGAVMAHRVIWSYFNGPIPIGLVINHINGKKSDNTIANLEVVTTSENHLHALRTGLRVPARGLATSRGKLSDEDVAAIRSLLSDGTYLQREIAAMYNVRPNLISRIKTGARRAA